MSSLCILVRNLTHFQSLPKLFNMRRRGSDVSEPLQRPGKKNRFYNHPADIFSTRYSDVIHPPASVVRRLKQSDANQNGIPRTTQRCISRNVQRIGARPLLACSQDLGNLLDRVMAGS